MPEPEHPHHTADDLLPVRLRRHVPILAVAGITIAVAGYLTGIREPRGPELPPPPVTVPRAGVPDAVDYSRLPTAKLHPATETTGSLAQLKFDKPGIFDAVTRTDEMKLKALADRAKNRAYDGAPPTIPHPVEAQSAAACLACHRDGIKVGDRVASAVSHAHFSNCLQCHVAQESVPVANDFLGVYRAGTGTRASPGAPPTIPHNTWMRENCMSCHGLVTRPGIRTTHPWLTNCTQCHAPSATTDQRDFFGANAMTQPTFEDGPPVPMMVDGVMDEATLRQLFRDLASAATVLTVREKRGPTTVQSPEAYTLEAVESQLLAGTMRAVQIRYRFSDFEWTDTILSGPDGFRVVRCRHD